MICFKNSAQLYLNDKQIAKADSQRDSRNIGCENFKWHENGIHRELKSPRDSLVPDKEHPLQIAAKSIVMQAKQLLAIEKFQKSRTRRIIGSKENYNECFVKLKEIYSFLHTELQSVLTLSDLIEGKHDNKIGHHKNFKDNNRFLRTLLPII